MNPSDRATVWDLSSRHHDLLVIGGGITGAGLAREAALAGLSVALVDARDFAGGTSAKSSRLIHGGLRYLEQQEWHLVREALRERRTLLRIAPHLVHPLAFLFPVFKGDRVPRWKVEAGLILYDLLALGGNVRRHRILSKRGLLDLEPLIRSRGLTGGALYWDAQCDDARLTLATVRAAAAHGALVANHTDVVQLLQVNGRITGAVVKDQLSGAAGTVQARTIVNATGPWCDEVRRLEDPAATPLLRTTRGSHLVVPRARLGHHHAVTFMSPLDGRVMFVLPWNEQSYIGTTDVDDSGSADLAAPTEEEVHYLLRSANALFPGAHLGNEDIISSWAGLRPLIRADTTASASAVSREHQIVVGPHGMISVAGGKLTTYRHMAEEICAQVAQQLKDQGHPIATRAVGSTSELLPGGHPFDLATLLETGQRVGVSEATVAHLAARYGAEAAQVLARIEENPTLAASLHPHHPAVGAEVLQSVEQEFGRRIDDVLVRRLHLRYETADAGRAALETTATLMGEALGWSEQRRREEVERYATVSRLGRLAVTNGVSPRTFESKDHV